MKPVLAALGAALVLAGTAQASSISSHRNVVGSGHATAATAARVHTPLMRHGAQTFSLYSNTFLDRVADGISGWPLTTVSENDPLEWASLYGVDTSVLGFACPTVTDPANICYHRIFLGPVPTLTFTAWFNGHAPSYWDAAVAIMTITHESNHYKLMSADEGRVNACALQQFPGVLDTYFGIHPTITKTVAVRKIVYRTTNMWARRNGRRALVEKRVKSVRVVNVEQTITNPDYTSLVQASRAFYASQPPPYNSGTCS